jgi:glycosyltransferase involved in cell wall biosynthesis
MRVKIVSCLTKHCGIGRYTHELGQGLYKLGEHVDVYRKDEANNTFAHTYPYRSLRNMRNYIAPYYLYKAIKSYDSDIWHADYVDAALALSMIKNKKKKVVTTAHDAIPFFYGKGFDKLHYKFLLKKADKLSNAIIVVSKRSKEDLSYYSGINPDKIHVIYNGINHEQFYPDEIKKRNSVFTIRYIGGLGAPHKNAPLLIEVARLLAERRLEFNMEIAGGYPENTGLPGMVKQYNLSQVKFTGFVPDKDLRNFLAGADLFLFPSAYEGFGFPPLEAIACGTPTVSSNGGSLSEVLKGGAVLVEPNPEAFADQIVRLMNDRELYKKLRCQGISIASNFTWEKTVQNTLSLYRMIN